MALLGITQALTELGHGDLQWRRLVSALIPRTLKMGI